MSRHATRFGRWIFALLTIMTGCHPVQPFYLAEDGDLSHYLESATQIEHPDVEIATLDEVSGSAVPSTIVNPNYQEMWDLTLEEAVSIAMNNSKVIKELGRISRGFQGIGLAQRSDTVLQNPDFVSTIYDPAIQETRVGAAEGVEAALSAFDAQVASSVTWDRTNRPQNFQAIFTPTLEQDQVNMQTELSKRAATGTQFFFRNITNYDKSNQPIRALDSDWFQALELEARQPLLQGRGEMVNRIPIVLARLRTDVRLADMEASVRNAVNDVERTYWELYFAYRNLSATKTGRDSALATWQRVNALAEASAEGGEADKAAQAMEQYYFFRSRVEEALRDLYRVEGQLRRLMGIAPSDGRLIRPIDEPTTAKVEYDWCAILEESITRSVELRRQKWILKQRELELTAAKNQLLPQLDAVMLYRWLGVGDQLIGEDRNGLNFPAPGSTAWDELTEGNYQEGRLGLQMNMPLGFRAAHSAVRNAQLQIARERAVLEELELDVAHNLADAYQQTQNHHKLTETNLARLGAAAQQVKAVAAAYEAGTATFDLLLDAQRRRADAEVAYFQSLVDYNLSLLHIHYRKGSLLEYNNIFLAEGPWPGKAYFDALNQARRRDASVYFDYGFTRPGVLSRGPLPQHTGQAAENMQGSGAGQMMAPGVEVTPNENSDGLRDPAQLPGPQPTPADGAEPLPAPVEEEEATETPAEPMAQRGTGPRLRNPMTRAAVTMPIRPDEQRSHLETTRTRSSRHHHERLDLIPRERRTSRNTTPTTSDG